MNLIPSKKQFNKWSLPSKVTYISGLLAVISIVLSLAFFVESKINGSDNNAEILRELLEMKEKCSNSNLDDCDKLLERELGYTSFQIDSLVKLYSSIDNDNYEIALAFLVKGDTLKADNYIQRGIINDKDARVFSLNGFRYQVGLGVRKDDSIAYKNYLHSIKLGGDKYAYNNIAIYYHDGIVAPKNLQRAISCYNQAIDLGSTSALYNLGSTYYLSDKPEDKEKGIKLYELAAEEGHCLSKYNLSIYYKDFALTQPNSRVWYEKSLKYALESDECGNEVIANHLGLMYLNGLGADIDRDKGIYYLHKAISNGFNEARVNLGLYYIVQLSDYDKGYEYLSDKSLERNQKARSILCNMYRNSVNLSEYDVDLSVYCDK